MGDQAEQLRVMFEGKEVKLPVTHSRLDQVDILCRGISYDYSKNYFILKDSDKTKVSVAKWGNSGNLVLTLGYQSVIINFEMLKDISEMALKHGHDYQYDLVVESGVKIVEEELDKKDE